MNLNEKLDIVSLVAYCLVIKEKSSPSTLSDDALLGLDSLSLNRPK